MAAVVNRIQDASATTRDRGMQFLDNRIPPSRRSELSQALKGWMNENPKLAAFVLAHVLLSAPPALLFIVFSTSVLVTSLVTTFLTALVLALSFTAFCTGLALLVLLPTLLITTITATLLFLGGLIVYLILHKFNNDPRTEAIRTKSKESILYSKDRASEGIDGLLKNPNEEKPIRPYRPRDSTSPTAASSPSKTLHFDATPQHSHDGSAQSPSSPVNKTLPHTPSYTSPSSSQTATAVPAPTSNVNYRDMPIVTPAGSTNYSKPKPSNITIQNRHSPRPANEPSPSISQEFFSHGGSGHSPADIANRSYSQRQHERSSSSTGGSSAAVAPNLNSRFSPRTQQAGLSDQPTLRE